MPVLRKQFVNLHAHSHGSLLDGMSRVDDYAQRALELGQPAIAFTDHGNLFSLMENYKGAKQAGIPYIPGIEAYMARKTRFDMDQEERSGPASSEWEQRGPYHQTILAVSNAGYHNLLRLSSDSFREGYFVKGRVDKELIAKYSEGLVVLSGCLSGEVQQAILRDDFAYALEAAATMQEIVGKENYFIEIMNHGIDEELRVHSALIEIAKRIGAPIVPTGDSHYTMKEDAVAHDHLLCITTGAKINTPNRFKFSGADYYLKSYEEMCDIFPAEWVENSLLVYDKLNIDLDDELNTSHYPVFKVPQEHIKLQIPDYFVRQIGLGAEQRFGPNWKTERRDVADRLNKETKMIQTMGYDSYFLIVADIINWCDQEGILVGPGRGSSAGSMVSYCLGITHIDPLEYGLLFERFLTPGRVPDIDIDVDDRYRERVLDYIRNKYGHDHTAQIITMSRLKAKSVVNDLSRVLDYPFEFGQNIVGNMPPAEFGITKTLKQCLTTERFRNEYEKDESVKQVIDLGLELEELWRSDGIHAGGIIIADRPITDYCPTHQKGVGKPVVMQWDMKTAENIGLLKMDLLGLRNLAIIDDTIDRVREKEGVDLGDPWDMARNPSKEVFRSLSHGKTGLVFQMGSAGLTDLVKVMGIDSITDIMAALALYRPGPMGSGFHIAYPKRKKGRQKPIPLHPLLKDVLSNTYGILLYQEQVMAIATDLAGFDAVQANKFLKSIGKKDREVMAATKTSFVQGCIDKVGISTQEAIDLFTAIEPHADYSFSASHAAVYAYISYVTAHLKHFYPAHYSAASLTAVMLESEDKFRPVLNDVIEKVGVEVTSPSVNRSQFDFDSDGEKVIYSISGLKRIGEKKSTPFVEFRNEKQIEYDNIHHFFRNANTNSLDKIFIESLVYSGAMDELVRDKETIDAPVDIETHLNALLLELQTLGVCITENPFLIYYNNIEFASKTLPASEILDPKNGRVHYCGVIRDVEFKVSKAGRRFIKFKVDDGVAILDGLCSGKSVGIIEEKFGKLENVLQSGAFISFYGSIKNDTEDEDAVIFIAGIETIHSPESMGDLVNSITLKLQSVDDLGHVTGILAANPGNKKVYIQVKHPDADIMIRKLSEFRISSDVETLLKEYIEV